MWRRAIASVFVMAGLNACATPSSPIADASPDASNTLEVQCDGSTTHVSNDAVQAKTDGVDLIVHNASTGQLLVQWDGGGDGADPGDTRFVFPIPPGAAKVRCQRLSEDPGSSEGWAPFTVVAPPDWVSPTLDCPGGFVTGNGDYAPDAVGVPDPVADTRKRADGADVAEAGYGTDQSRTIVAFTDGVVTETYGYTSDGQGGWLLTTTSACD
jgi:hypothetical protein